MQTSNKKKSKKFLNGKLIAVAILFGVGTLVSAQVSAYTFSQVNGTYTPITGNVIATATGNTYSTNLNVGNYTVNLPFNFIFNNLPYDKVFVSSEGFVTFGSAAFSTVLNPISSSQAYNGAISAYGNNSCSFYNIGGVTGSISWNVQGAAPNRVITIQWANFRPGVSDSTTNVYSHSFQIKLEETSNIISIVYSGGSNLVGSVSKAAIIGVGLRGATNNDFNARENTTTESFSNSTPGTNYEARQSIDTINPIPGMPSAGLTYIWTPPAVLSTIEVKANNDIKIYPNPFSEIVNISKPELVKSITISDVTGKLLKTVEQPGSVLRLSDISKGVYILKIEKKDGSKSSHKLIKK